MRFDIKHENTEGVFVASKAVDIPSVFISFRCPPKQLQSASTKEKENMKNNVKSFTKIVFIILSFWAANGHSQTKEPILPSVDTAKEILLVHRWDEHPKFEEAIRVVKLTSGKWKHGIDNGVPKNMSYTIPIKIRLE